jgi:hypothetical protein
MENMMTTAINILATLRRVLSWLSSVRFDGFNLQNKKNLSKIEFSFKAIELENVF